MLHDLVIFQKTYDLLFWVKKIVPKFAKVHKYSLGIQLENGVLDLLEAIIQANMSYSHKNTLIKACLAKHEMVRVFVRLSKDLKLISLKQYEYASEKITEIGKMLNAWEKRFRK